MLAPQILLVVMTYEFSVPLSHLVLLQLSTGERSGLPHTLFFEVLYISMFDHLKNHFQISSPGKMYNPGSCNILNQWLVIAFPGPQFSQGNGSMAPSIRTLTSVLGTSTFILLQPPTRKATPGSYLGWLLLQPWNLKQQVPLSDPSLLSFQSSLTTLVFWPHPEFQALDTSLLTRLLDLSLAMSLPLAHW